MKRRIGIDLGGTKTEVLLSEQNPLEVIERKRVPTGQEKGYGFIVEQIAGLVKDFLKVCDEPPAIGIGIPGTLNHKTGLVRNANTQCLIGQPFKADLEKAIGQPVYVENDANCFALSEALFGAGKGYGRVMGIIMGTGMGGGLVENGRIWSGSMGIAAEFGHSTINYNGPECWCGNKGCLEMYISGSGAERHYKELTGQTKKLAQIYADFEAGEGAAQECINTLLFHFGLGLGNLITCFDPDVVVIGGGASNLPILYDQGVAQIRSHIFNDELTTPILKNQLGDSSGVFGAALLADN
ncbi:MAG: ROK family protein [bacterium]|nr:ROK family protein [bacterium]